MNNKSLSDWATHPSNRERVSHSDGFRIEFQRDRETERQRDRETERQRDRDRIIWSNGFRKLADPRCQNSCRLI